MPAEFIGNGWAFPVTTDPTGRIALVSGDQKIQQSIRLILGTAHGERPMRPEFGCAINEYVFAPADATTAGHVAYEVGRALERWEPRIDVDDIDVSIEPDDPSTLYIDIRYRHRGTNDPRNLVFPFYVLPDEADTPAGTGGATP